MQLEHIDIFNLGLYSHASLSIDAGLNIIIGESGSGKSMLYDLLNFGLGFGSVDKALIRSGAPQGLVCLTFRPKATEAQDAPLEETIIKRSIDTQGRSRTTCDGQPISLKQLKELCKDSVFLSKQHAQLALNSASHWLAILDHWVDPSLIHNYQKHYEQTQQLKREIASKQKNHLDPETLTHVSEQLKPLEELFETLGGMSYDILEGTLRELEQQQVRSQALEDFQARLDAASLEAASVRCYPQLTEAEKESMDQLMHALTLWQQHTPSESERITLYQSVAYYDEKLSRMHTLAKRLQTSPLKLEATYQALQEQLSLHHAAAVLLKTHEQALTEANQTVELHAHKLTQARLEAAQTLLTQLQKALPELGMPHTTLYSKHHTTVPSAHGCDRFEILMTSHADATPGAIKDIASGGELSRLLLLVNSIVPQEGCYLFDEVDAGISGKTAMMVGKYLHSLANARPVVVISHTPQVAAFADHLWRLEKSIEETPETRLYKLNKAEHADGLSMILNGDAMMDSAHIHAQRLIQQAQLLCQAATEQSV